ncbi:MAG: type II secretion system protein [Phycisphaeraceae bacterium]
MATPTRQTTSGFTLVEMLLVVAIIALLIAMLLPMLSSAKSAARSSVCMTQQNQIFGAIVSYVTTNSNRYPPRRNWGRWYDNITTKTPINAMHANAYWGVAYADAYGRESLRPFFSCPEALTSDQNTSSSNAALGFTDGKFEDGNIYCTYGFNGLDLPYATSQGVLPAPYFNYALGTRPGRLHNRIADPSNLILFQDAFEHLLDGNGDMPWSFTQWVSVQNREYFRHNMNRTGNVVWADGHSEAVANTFAWTAQPYAGR